jgi:type IV pilus assembly protein PilB
MSLFRSIFRNKAKEGGPEASNEYQADQPQNSEVTAWEKTSPEEFLEHWIIQAVEMRASDIHFEKFRTYLKVRYRIDGKLHTTTKLPGNLHGGIVSRVKILAKLKIDEKRLPQDERFAINRNSH